MSKMLDPTPELPDATPISEVELPARIRNVLVAAGLKTVGEVRETSDEILLSFQDLGKNSVAHLREILGLPSTDGVRPLNKSRPWFADLKIPRMGKMTLAGTLGLINTASAALSSSGPEVKKWERRDWKNWKKWRRSY
jgi:hypothetical protein